MNGERGATVPWTHPATRDVYAFTPPLPLPGGLDAISDALDTPGLDRATSIAGDARSWCLRCSSTACAAEPSGERLLVLRPAVDDELLLTCDQCGELCVEAYRCQHESCSFDVCRTCAERRARTEPSTSAARSNWRLPVGEIPVGTDLSDDTPREVVDAVINTLKPLVPSGVVTVLNTADVRALLHHVDRRESAPQAVYAVTHAPVVVGVIRLQSLPDPGHYVAFCVNKVTGRFEMHDSKPTWMLGKDFQAFEFARVHHALVAVHDGDLSLVRRPAQQVPAQLRDEGGARVICYLLRVLGMSKPTVSGVSKATVSAMQKLLDTRDTRVSAEKRSSKNKESKGRRATNKPAAAAKKKK